MCGRVFICLILGFGFSEYIGPQVYFSEIMTDKYWLIRLDRCTGCPLSRCFLSVLSHRGYMPVAYVGTDRLDV